MRAYASILKAVPLVLGMLLVLFLFLSFVPPLVPLSKVNYEGCERVQVDKVAKYVQSKLVMGMVPTSNSQFADATKMLGPLVEKIEMKKGFFFSATVVVTEKKDFYVINYGSDRIKVDVLGNFIEGSPPDNAPIVLSVKYVDPTGNEDILPKSEYAELLQPCIAEVLKTRKSFPATITEVMLNRREFVQFGNGRTFCLVAPKSFSAWASGVALPSTTKRVYLENVAGIFAKTAQGSLIVFGDDNGMDVKFGSVALLLEGLRLEKKAFPLVIKADIPYQVTSVQ